MVVVVPDRDGRLRARGQLDSTTERGLFGPASTSEKSFRPFGRALTVSDGRFTLSARVSTDAPEAVRALLEQLFPRGSVTAGAVPGEFLLHAELVGPSARDLNRRLLSELRRAEKRTRLRAEWSREGVTERFFDYVPKGTRKA